MTTDETRDELARMDGWFPPGTHPPRDQPPSAMGQAMSRQWVRGCWWRVESGMLRRSRNHPHPPTLDGANAAVPEGWTWVRWSERWEAYHDGMCNDVSVPDHGRGHEMDDLYALALACRRAMEERK